MKQLAELIQDIDCTVTGSVDVVITGLAYHSAKVLPGALFVAIDGAHATGRDFVDDAIARGARAVASSDTVGIRLNQGSVIKTSEPRRFLAQVAHRFFDFPNRAVRLVGVTGTNGKTTTTYIIRSLLDAWGERSGLIGTIRHYDGREWIKAVNTTPESLDIVQLLAQLRTLGIRYCVMEVSSHGIAMGRISGLEFDVGVFTNLTHDHLDFHGSMEEYKRVKLSFFEQLSGSAWAVYNADDPVGHELRAATKARRISYAWSSTPSNREDYAEIRGEAVRLSDRAMTVRLLLNGQEMTVPTTLVGRHNVYNIMAGAGVAQALGLAPGLLEVALQRLKSVPGRMKRVDNRANLSVFIDYAHTPDALANLLASARSILEAREDEHTGARHRLILVVGCGGNRDREKRPLMGKVATELADHVILTSDNPRD
ncbi:MAG: UDP-N-acetylmuramoyl-L-alanyl-D-glutamate--2,6-diaminopimelate ligase, partial [candidate division WOR-3 bacterium]